MHSNAIIKYLDEDLDRGPAAFAGATPLSDLALYGEYTLHLHETFTAVAGAGLHSYKGFAGAQGMRFVPRATVKYQPFEALVLRLNGGRGLRAAMPLTDNIGVFSTGKTWTGVYDSHILEDAWTWGGSATVYLPFGADPDNAYLSFDYFHTAFGQQLIVDYEHFVNGIDFYASAGAPSYTDTFQADLFLEPFRRFTVNMTARYTDARVSLLGKGLVELVESGKARSAEARSRLESLLAPYADEQVDAVVLGCTHYPVLPARRISMRVPSGGR